MVQSLTDGFKRRQESRSTGREGFLGMPGDNRETTGSYVNILNAAHCLLYGMARNHTRLLCLSFELHYPREYDVSDDNQTSTGCFRKFVMDLRASGTD